MAARDMGVLVVMDVLDMAVRHTQTTVTHTQTHALGMAVLDMVAQQLDVRQLDVLDIQLAMGVHKLAVQEMVVLDT